MMPNFRAWVKEYEVMCKVDGLDWHVKQVAVDELEKGLVTEFKWDEVELMQSTGLKDKNGVEIYEGDFLYEDTGEEGLKIIVEVVYVDGCFMGKERGFEPEYPLSHFTNSEVIGNIYENLELLKEQNK